MGLKNIYGVKSSTRIGNKPLFLAVLIGGVAAVGYDMYRSYNSQVNDLVERQSLLEQAVLKADSNRDGVLSDGERTAWYNAMGIDSKKEGRRILGSEELKKYLSQ